MAEMFINWLSWNFSIAAHLRRRDSGTVTIYKVPERLRRDKNDAYEPRIMSFGPYHHGKPSLQAMEKYKWSFLEVILSFRPETPWERYKEAIKEDEAKIRTCYTDDFDIDSEEFVEMMLIDGCFLVGYLLQFYYGVSDELYSIVGMHDLIRYDILLLENQLPFFVLIKIFDLLQFTPSSGPSSFMDLAINYLNCWVRDARVNFQPPESVQHHHLLHLYHSHCLYTPQAGEGSLVSTHGEEPDPIHQSPSATVLHEVDSISVPIDGEESDPIHRPQPPRATVLPAADSISATIYGEESDPIHRPQPPSATALHEVDSICVPIDGEESEPIHRPQTTSATVFQEVDSISVPIDEEESDPIHRPQPPSATVLHEAGVKFEKKEVKGSSSLDVTFDITNGKMMIPPLVIDTFNKSKLRNLVAFEQLYPNFDKLDKSFTAYVEFLDFIVNTPEDVALLHKEGIICHYLGSDKNAADFLNDLNQGVFVKSEHYLAPLYRDVYHYQQKRTNKWQAMLRHNYCNTPCAILGIGVGGILLLLTLLQTILSGISAF